VKLTCLDTTQATKTGIPPGARWTKIDRRLVNPQALEEAKERFEERLECVIVLRVLTKEEIQKLADRTSEIRGNPNLPSQSNSRPPQTDTSAPTTVAMKAKEERGKLGKRRFWTFHGSRDLSSIIKHSLTPYSYPADERYEEDRAERKATRKRERNRDRQDNDEYSDHSEDEYAKRAPRMLEAPPASSASVGAEAPSEADFVRDNRERRRERESEREAQYMSGGLGGRRD